MILGSMVDIDKKRMVFAFYLNENSLENPINKIHFSFLEKYINKFARTKFNKFMANRKISQYCFRGN